MSNQVTYQTPNKEMKTGYIIDGKTYKNPEGTQRVDVGSTVYTAGGDFLMTEAGGVKLPGSVANDIRSAYQNSQAHLGNAYNAQKGAINTATKRALEQINDQRQTAQKQYANSNRAAYQAYVGASNPYGAADEQRARLGLANSGYSETSKMRLANTYQQALSENSLAHDEYMRELDKAYRDARYNGDIQLANALADYQKLVYQHGINAAEAIAAQENAAYNAGIAANQAQWNRDVYQHEQDLAAEQRESEAKQRLFENAYTLARIGLSNEQIADALGVSLAELNRIVKR